MNCRFKVSLVLAALLLTQLMQAQRGGGHSGGGARGGSVRLSGGPSFRGSVPSVPHVSGVPFGRRSFAPAPFVGVNGVHVRGVVGFGHNPRFHVGFGSGFRSGFRRSCFGCGFGGPVYYYSGVPFGSYYPGYAYDSYPAYYSQPYANEQPSPYVVEHGEASYPAAYQQGATDQKIQELSEEVDRLRAELDSRATSTYPDRVAHSGPSPQEISNNVTLVLANGRRLQIHNYAIIGQTIWILDEKAAKKLSVAELNLDATKQVNADNGVSFQVPGMR